MSKHLLLLAAGAAMAASAPLAAQDTTSNRDQARQNSQGPANANQRGVDRSNQNSVLRGTTSRNGEGTRTTTREQTDMQDRQMDRRQNSQGAANASDRARERANSNSAVAQAEQGMEVRDRNGRRVGQVREIRRDQSGTVIAIVVVLVVQVNGTNTVTLPAGSFTIINNVVVINNLNVTVNR